MSANLELIVANTNPTVEVYKIDDSANNRNYVLAQDGASTSNPTALSIQIDYSVLYDRIADALETLASNSTTIKDHLGFVNTNISAISTNISTINTNLSNVVTHMNTVATEIQTIDNSLSASVNGSYANVVTANITNVVTVMNNIRTELTALTTQSTASASHLSVIKNHFAVERAVLAAIDIKAEDLPAVKAEITSPTLP